MQAAEQIARRVAARDEAALHILYRKFAAQSVFGKDFVGNTQILQFFRAHVA